MSQISQASMPLEKPDEPDSAKLIHSRLGTAVPGGTCLYFTFQSLWFETNQPDNLPQHFVYHIVLSLVSLLCYGYPCAW